MIENPMTPVGHSFPAVPQTVPVLSQQQLIELLMESLRADDYSAGEVQAQIDNLTNCICKSFRSRENNPVYENALERSPWLSADAVKLQRDRTELMQVLQSLCLAAPKFAHDDRRVFEERITDLAERLVDHDLAETHFLQLAFHGPD